MQSAKPLIRPKPPDVYWLEQAETEMPATNDWLSTPELVRLEGMRFAKRRADWRLGRWTAKCAVAIYRDAPLNARTLAGIEIFPASDGAPEVIIGNQPAAVTISLSHRAGVASCAVTAPGVGLGCDLELIETRSVAFVADYFTTEEQALVAQASVRDRPLIAALLWSAKESALKALRVGLRVDTRCVNISLLDALLDEHADQYEGRSFVVQTPSGFNGWRRLRAYFAGGQQVFHGWWQYTASHVRTLASTLQSGPPIPLSTARVAQSLCSVS